MKQSTVKVERGSRGFGLSLVYRGLDHFAQVVIFKKYLLTWPKVIQLASYCYQFDLRSTQAFLCLVLCLGETHSGLVIRPKQ